MKTSHLFLLVLPLILSSCGSSNGSGGIIIDDSTSTIDPSLFALKWEDNFDGDSLNMNNWEYMVGDGSDYGNPGWGNSEQEYYTAGDNAVVENGELIITARNESRGEKPYTSTRLRSKGKVYTTYGIIEARISLPEVEGMWPAFWMLPETNTYGGWPYSGEIDIIEAKGRVVDSTSAALHYGGPGDIYQSKNKIYRDSTISDYHVFGVIWMPDEINFYVDGETFLTVKSTGRQSWYTVNAEDNERAPFDVDFHILLNLAVGGHFDNYITPPDDFVSADMRVDYVRIYEYLGEVD